MFWGLGRREKKKKDCPPVQFCAQSVQSGVSESRMAQGLGSEAQRRLFEQIRQAVPLVDAAIGKIIRLVGDFELECSNRQAQEELRRWCSQVPVGAGGSGLRQFLHSYLDDLLTYGNAVGEMVPFCEGEGIAALYNVPLENILIRQGENPLDVKLFANSRMGEAVELAHPERVLYTALNPKAGSVQGRSLLEGLPFVSSVLLNIYQAIGQNFERMGNLRFAVTYKPQGGVDGAYAREIAQQMASQWADTMRESGQVKDFVAVGDVNIKVIGADNQALDTQVPVRQMLEQIVAKLGLPPFILGLSWSTTERMSQQQSEILASELESYRALLTPVILRICRYHLEQTGLGGKVQVKWKHISIADEVEQARAKLLDMQAKEIEAKIGQRDRQQEGEQDEV